MNYDDLLNEADPGLIIKEKPLKYNDGRLKGSRLAIRSDLTQTQKKCVLAEELGHYYTTVGSIIEQTDSNNLKQELKARIWAYNKLVGLSGIIEAYRRHCMDLQDMADYLEITEEFLMEALAYYKEKYGVFVKEGNYIIYFEPSIGVLELL